MLRATILTAVLLLAATAFARSEMESDLPFTVLHEDESMEGQCKHLDVLLSPDFQTDKEHIIELARRVEAAEPKYKVVVAQFFDAANAYEMGKHPSQLSDLEFIYYTRHRVGTLMTNRWTRVSSVAIHLQETEGRTRILDVMPILMPKTGEVAKQRPAGEITKLHPEVTETGGAAYFPDLDKGDWKPYVWDPKDSDNENSMLEALNRSVAPPGSLSPLYSSGTSDASSPNLPDNLKASPQEIARNIAKEKAEEQKRQQALQKAGRATSGDSTQKDTDVVVGATPAPW